MSMSICKMCCSASANGFANTGQGLRRSITGNLLQSQRGLGYVALLGLLALVSTLALAFVHQVGIETTVNQNRIHHIQSDYLARSAANHALWRLLNDPEFTPTADTYTMHSMAGGRYGYKVRRPGPNTFGTVAAVGAVQDVTNRQSYVQYIIPEDVITVYGRTANPVPEYRRLVGAGLSDPAGTVNVGSNAAYWMDLEGCPLRTEMLMATINDVDAITLAVWDGASWGNTHILGSNGDRDSKCFDVTYESQSGRALAVGRTDASTAAYFNIWDGNAWLHASPQPAFNIGGGTIDTLITAACPGNDQILIATASNYHELVLFFWDGNGFTDLGTIESSLDSSDFGIAQLVYERQSGDALIIWPARGEVRYRVWNGAFLGPETIIPHFTADVFFLSADPDPSSDHIVVAGVDKFYDLTLAIWDGSAWVDGREVETSTSNISTPVVDVAWESDGDEVLVAWAPWGLTHIRYLSWRKGTALADSTVQAGPDFGQQPWLVRLLPLSQSQQIMMLGMTNSEVLRYSLWTGSQFKGDPAVVLASDIIVQNDLAFDLTEANVPITGGTGTGGAAGNQPPMVDAGPDQFLIYPDVTIQFDGTVSDDGLPDPPSSVTTQWTLVSGPGAFGFGDDSLIDAQAKVDSAGTYVFRLTASDGELSSYDEVEIFISNFCDADITPTAKIREFTTTAYGSGDTQSVTYLPEGIEFYGVAAPSEGALLSVDTMDDTFYMIAMDGTLLAQTSTATPSTKGVALLTTGSFANHLATVDSSLNTLTFVNMKGIGEAQLSLSPHGIGQAAGIAFIETTAGGTYDGHIAVLDRVTESVYVIDQAGTLKTIIDVNDGTADAAQDVGHLPGYDKIIVPYLHQVCIYDFDGTLLRQYDTAVFGANDLESVIIDPNCNHIIADKGADKIIYLADAGGGLNDSDPPTPDPMTWASPPAAVDATSITMTATTASDASGVQYYFECIAGGCHDSGWQTDSTYVDTGLTSGNTYAYRVKARDMSDGRNETGWSIEAKAATLANSMYVLDITMSSRSVAKKFYGRAAVWIRATDGSDVEGAVVTGEWSGSVSGSVFGTTGPDGQVRFESTGVRGGGTFTFSVTNVVKTSYTYQPKLNIETSDTITAP